MLPAEAPVAIIGRQPPVPKGTGGCLWDGCLRRACLLAAGGVVGSSVREIRVSALIMTSMLRPPLRYGRP